MRYTSLLGKTIKDKSPDFQTPGQALLQAGGFVRAQGDGLNSLLPLGRRVMNRLADELRRRMDALGGQEVSLPLVGALEPWRRSGRDRFMGEEMIRFKDRRGEDLVLSPTHEEAMVELVKGTVTSCQELPLLLYQIGSKFRDEGQARGGLLRSREFTMKDAYSFHKSGSDLNNFFPRMHRVYSQIFADWGLPLLVAESGVGVMGGSRAFEFLMPSSSGEVTAIVCTNCGYTADQEIARGRKDVQNDPPLPMEWVPTPDCRTNEQLARFLQKPLRSLTRSLVFEAKSGPVMAVVRADHAVSLDKLAQLLGEPVLRKLPREAVENLGLVPGFFSPVEKDPGFRVVVDEAVADSSNLVFGANQEGYSWVNVNFGRDFETPLTGDIAKIGANERCPYCSHPLDERTCLEIGHIFKLEDFYARSLGLEIPDDRGRLITPLMGCYGIGLGRLMAAVAEVNHDDKGLVWPACLAPFTFSLLTLGDSLRVKKAAADLEARWPADCLLDDRHESPGIKFADSDLLGIPLRICLSRMLIEKGLAEFKDRRTGEIRHVPLDQVDDEIFRFQQSERGSRA